MTATIRPAALSILDEAPWDLADTDVIDLQPVTETVRWVPTLPEMHIDEIRHHPGLSTDAEVLGKLHEAADERHWEAWAREMKATIRAAKTARTKRVKALRRQVAGTP